MHGSLIFFGLTVLMRWLLIGLLISVGVLLFVAGGVAWHILRQRRVQGEEALGKAEDRGLDHELDRELGLEPELDPTKESDLKRLPDDRGE
jgi:hypothetical protein